MDVNSVTLKLVAVTPVEGGVDLTIMVELPALNGKYFPAITYRRLHLEVTDVPRNYGLPVEEKR